MKRTVPEQTAEEIEDEGLRDCETREATGGSEAVSKPSCQNLGCCEKIMSLKRVLSAISDQSPWSNSNQYMRVPGGRYQPAESSSRQMPLIVYKYIDGELVRSMVETQQELDDRYFCRLDTLTHIRRGSDSYLHRGPSNKCRAYLKTFMDEIVPTHLPTPSILSYEECFAVNYLDCDTGLSPKDLEGISVLPPSRTNPLHAKLLGIFVSPKGHYNADRELLVFDNSSGVSRPANGSGSQLKRPNPEVKCEDTATKRTLCVSKSRISKKFPAKADVKVATILVGLRSGTGEKLQETRPMYPESSFLHECTGVWRSSAHDLGPKNPNPFLRARSALAPFLTGFSFGEISLLVSLIFYDEVSFNTSDYFALLNSCRVVKELRECDASKSSKSSDSDRTGYPSPTERKSFITKKSWFSSSVSRDLPEELSEDFSECDGPQDSDVEQQSSSKLGPNAALKTIQGTNTEFMSASGFISTQFSMVPPMTSIKAYTSTRGQRSLTRKLLLAKSKVLLEYALLSRFDPLLSILRTLGPQVFDFLNNIERELPNNKLVRNYKKLILLNKAKVSSELEFDGDDFSLNHVSSPTVITRKGLSFSESLKAASFLRKASRRLCEERLPEPE